MTWCRIWHHRSQSTFFSSVLWCLVARQTRTRSSATQHFIYLCLFSGNVTWDIDFSFSFFFCPIRQLHEAIYLPWASREVLILSPASAYLLIYSLTNVHYPHVRWILAPVLTVDICYIKRYLPRQGFHRMLQLCSLAVNTSVSFGMWQSVWHLGAKQPHISV